MNSKIDNDTITCLIKSNPDFEVVVQHMIKTFNNNTGILVHELRNPLTIIKSTIQYIEMKHPESKDFKYWNQLQTLAMEMESIMADASTLNICSCINKKDSNLISLLDEIVNNYEPQASSQDKDLKLIVSPEDEPYYRSYFCDSARIKQVFSNLVKNAIDATIPGDYIHIKLRYLPGNERVPTKLCLDFCNNGNQIPEDEIHTIFNPYITYKKDGTGIGLAIVERIVNLHYGTIKVASSEDETSFTILLPL